MFFLKSKPKSENILPPPPPISGNTALDRNPKNIHPLFDETKTQKVEESKSEIEVNLKKEVVPNKGNISKKTKLRKDPIKKANLEEAKGTSDFDFNLNDIVPSNKVNSTDIDIPDYLKNFNVEDFGIGKKFDGTSIAGPAEILEAKEEIKSAIENIKNNENPSFFNRVFAKPANANDFEGGGNHLIVNDFTQDKSNHKEILEKLQVSDEVSIIQNNLKKAKISLAKLDLKIAKENYIEIMKSYNRLKPTEQAKVYRDIQSLYFDRKSAEELKV